MSAQTFEATANGETPLFYEVEEHHHPEGSSTMLGFWMYLMSDCLIFAILFACYAVLGHSYGGGEGPKQLFELPLVALNTAMLLFSSLTYGFAMLTMERLYHVIDVLDALSEETGKAVPQIALNWLILRPTVSSIIIGARNEAQLRQNLGAVGWTLTPDQIARLDAASTVMPPYPHFPYRIQEGFARRNPPIVG